MSSRTKVIWISVFGAVLIAICAALATAPAQTKAAAPPPQDTLALAEGEVKQLLLLMDTDKNGKISKQEWMNFMEAYDWIRTKAESWTSRNWRNQNSA